MGSSLSQDLVSAFGQQRAVRSPGDLSKTQSVTTCSTVWVGWPHGHDAASCMPQSWRVSPTRAVPERRRLSRTHCLRGIGQHRAAATGWAGDRQIEWKVGQHQYGRSTPWVDHSCLRRDGQRVGRKVDVTWDVVHVHWRKWQRLRHDRGRWLGLSIAIFVRRATCDSRRMSGGTIPARTGRNVVSVGRIQPVMIRIESYRPTSSFPVWALRDWEVTSVNLGVVCVHDYVNNYLLIGLTPKLFLTNLSKFLDKISSILHHRSSKNPELDQGRNWLRAHPPPPPPPTHTHTHTHTHNHVVNPNPHITHVKRHHAWNRWNKEFIYRNTYTYILFLIIHWKHKTVPIIAHVGGCSLILYESILSTFKDISISALGIS